MAYQWTDADVAAHNAKLGLRRANRADALWTGSSVQQVGAGQTGETLTITAEVPKPSKWKNKRTTRDGKNFDSLGESKRDADLNVLQIGGAIRKLRRQIDFPLHVQTPIFPNVACIGDWRADWTYEEHQPDGTWKNIAEDFKGTQTAEFKWKKKHVEAEYDLTIRITRR